MSALERLLESARWAGDIYIYIRQVPFIAYFRFVSNGSNFENNSQITEMYRELIPFCSHCVKCLVRLRLFPESRRERKCRYQ